jgi:hypothetical protein
MKKLMNVIGQEAQNRAFGLPGEPGDPVKIKHMTMRFGDLYEEILDWAASLRGTICNEDCQPVLWALAKYADQPVRTVHSFANRVVVEMSRISDHIARGGDERLHISLELTFDIDAAASVEYNTELAKLLPDFSLSRKAGNPWLPARPAGQRT